jgi:outer membrane receptor protein involved in Fe transport
MRPAAGIPSVLSARSHWREFTKQAVRLLVAFPFVVQESPAREPTAAEAFEQVQITATRIPEPLEQVPADMSIISGEELRARGATA